MTDEGLLKQVEALNFRHLPSERRIVCDDPEIWVKDCGQPRERGHEFFLSLRGQRIGFREPPPESGVREETLREVGPVPGYDPLTAPRTTPRGGWNWVVDEVGCGIMGWENDEGPWTTIAHPRRFSNRDEQNLAIAIIRVALAAFTRPFPMNTPPPNYRVLFSRGLIDRLTSGGLIDER